MAGSAPAPHVEIHRFEGKTFRQSGRGGGRVIEAEHAAAGDAAKMDVPGVGALARTDGKARHAARIDRLHGEFPARQCIQHAIEGNPIQSRAVLTFEQGVDLGMAHGAHGRL